MAIALFSGGCGPPRICAAHPLTAPDLLDVQVYKPTSQSCSSTIPCGAAGRCINSTCAVAWAIRPSPDLYDGQPASESREFGGPTPNNIDFQVPVNRTDQGALYILVQQIPEAATGLAGFSATETYTITLTHKVEPDAGDKPLAPDNCYVARPLADTWTECLAPHTVETNDEWTNGAQRPAFFQSARHIDDGGTTSEPPQGAGSGWAVVTGTSAGASFVVPASCTQLGFAAYENLAYLVQHAEMWRSLAALRSVLTVPVVTMNMFSSRHAYGTCL